MNIGRADVMLLLVMSLSIVSMSFVFPALGLTNESVDQNDIPEFNITSDRFDLAGDIPTAPAPDKGVAWIDTTEGVAWSDNNIWLDGNFDSGGTQLLLTDQEKVVLNQYNSSSQVVDTDSVQLNSTTNRSILDVQNGYEVRIEKTDQYNSSYYEVSYEVTDQPNVGGSFVDRIPVVGGLFEAADSVAAVVAWLTSVVLWFLLWFVDLSANLIGILFDVVRYLFGMASWLATTYGGIISSANSWAGVFVALPGIIFSMILAKFVVIGIKLLPTT